MGKRMSYGPGTFSWTDLGTTDPDAAKAFYTDLFGWEAEDIPVPDAPPYSMMRLGGESAAAIYAQPKPQREAGVPPNWFSYVTVASADDAAAKAQQAGGTVHAEPFDVMQAGRMAVITDPTGAFFGVWEARDAIGATIVNEPGAFTWNELATSDVKRALPFYEELFGWEHEQMDTGEMPAYWMINHDGAAQRRNGGVRELAPEQAEAGVPPHWMPYFVSARLEDTLGALESGGGSKMFGPVEIIDGARIAVAADPQGAAFGLFEGETDD